MKISIQAIALLISLATSASGSSYLPAFTYTPAKLNSTFQPQRKTLFSPFTTQSVNPPSSSISQYAIPNRNAPNTSTGKLTSKDILARARQAAGVPNEEEGGPSDLSSNFSEDLLNDFQSVLVLLEGRVKEGPGSLSKEDLSEFESAADRIISDMKEYLQENSGKGLSGNRPFPVQSMGDVSTATLSPTSPVTTTLSAAPSQPPQAQTTETEIIDTSNDEGPSYTGKGGLGLAHGTTNTYIIPGMDEMSPEEYRDALQETYNSRQRQRRQSTGGISLGNMAATNYLDALGGNDNSIPSSSQQQQQQSETVNPNVPTGHKSIQKSSFEIPSSFTTDKPSFPVEHHDTPDEYKDPYLMETHNLVDNTFPENKPQTESKTQSEIIDTSNDEGPAYTGKGGLGLAHGTTNTYVIPGMDEMSPEEYREALQKSVSERQSLRRQSGVTGNRAAESYLENLNDY